MSTLSVCRDFVISLQVSSAVFDNIRLTHYKAYNSMAHNILNKKIQGSFLKKCPFVDNDSYHIKSTDDLVWHHSSTYLRSAISRTFWKTHFMHGHSYSSWSGSSLFRNYQTENFSCFILKRAKQAYSHHKLHLSILIELLKILLLLLLLLSQLFKIILIKFKNYILTSKLKL